MINLNDYPIFVKYVKSLKETSLDDRDKEHEIYMTESERKVIDFDKVKDEYIKKLKVSENPKSNDALFDDGNGSLVFVEFKNGFMDKPQQFSVRKKIYDSLLIFTDITSKGISYVRNNVIYILVYNESINQNNKTDEELQKKNKAMLQPSPSFDAFAKLMGQYAGEEYICFGIRIFKNYCFKEVHTFTQKEFELYLSKL